jgi:iron complex transport system ATP-binding protein
VLIGRALMARPRLLILDEPCAGLDPAAREHFLQFLQRIGRRAGAPTLVLVTHHVEEIMPVFSHVLILKGGRALAAGRMEGTLNSKSLSRAFGERTELKKKNGRYVLAIQTKSRGVI